MVAGGFEQEQHRLRSHNRNGILGGKSQMHRLLAPRIRGTTAPSSTSTNSNSSGKSDEPLLKQPQMESTTTEEGEGTVCTSCAPSSAASRRGPRRMGRRRVRAQPKVAPVSASTSQTSSSAGTSDWSAMFVVAKSPANEENDIAPLLESKNDTAATERDSKTAFLESTHILTHFPLDATPEAHTLSKTMLTSFTVGETGSQDEDEETTTTRSASAASSQAHRRESCRSFSSTRAMAGGAAGDANAHVLPISTIRLYHGDQAGEEQAEAQPASLTPLAPVKEDSVEGDKQKEASRSPVDFSYQLQLETERQELRKRKDDMVDFSMRRSCGLLLDLSSRPAHHRLRCSSSASTTSLSSASSSSESSSSSSTCFYSVSGMPSAATVRVLAHQQQQDHEERTRFSSVKSQSYTDRIEQRMNRPTC